MAPTPLFIHQLTRFQPRRRPSRFERFQAACALIAAVVFGVVLVIR